MATGPPVISADGLTRQVTFRSGMMWNTTPPGGDRRRRGPRHQARLQPQPGQLQRHGGLRSHDRGPEPVLPGYPAAAATSAAVMKQYIETHNVSGITTSGNTITFKLTRPAAVAASAR